MLDQLIWSILILIPLIEKYTGIISPELLKEAITGTAVWLSILYEGASFDLIESSNPLSAANGANCYKIRKIGINWRYQRNPVKSRVPNLES